MKSAYENLFNRKNNPAKYKVSQDELNKERRERVRRAAASRPAYLPIRHDLPSVASTTPHPKSTEPLLYDAIVCGAISNGENRKVKLSKNIDELPLVRTGREPGVNISLDAIAGKNVVSAGNSGVFEFPAPYNIEAGQVLTLEMFQETTTAATVHTVFCGVRVMSENADELGLTPEVWKSVENAIAARPAPETKFSVAKVTFTTEGTATAESPRADEPMFILGFRATFTDALVNFGFDTDKGFAKSLFPIWALCSEADNNKEKYLMLKEPLFVPANSQLYFSLKNTLDGVTFADNGQIEMLLSTM